MNLKTVLEERAKALREAADTIGADGLKESLLHEAAELDEEIELLAVRPDLNFDLEMEA